MFTQRTEDLDDVIAHACYLEMTSSDQGIRKLYPDVGVEYCFPNPIPQRFVDRFPRQEPLAPRNNVPLPRYVSYRPRFDKYNRPQYQSQRVDNERQLQRQRFDNSRPPLICQRCGKNGHIAKIAKRHVLETRHGWSCGRKVTQTH